MKRLRYAGLLPLVAVLVWGQAAAQGNRPALPTRPNALVSSLYEQVVARHPLSIPSGADMKIFAPYLSKALLHRFDLNAACFGDYWRRRSDPTEKPGVGMLEEGIFSGGDEKAFPKTFHIERTRAGKDGSSRVYVRLAWGSPPDKPMIWYVAAILVPENDRLVLNDVLYLKNKKGDVESSLSKGLSYQCDGARWVGEVRRPR
jgi:hypothetical protein